MEQSNDESTKQLAFVVMVAIGPTCSKSGRPHIVIGNLDINDFHNDSDKAVAWVKDIWENHRLNAEKYPNIKALPISISVEEDDKFRPDNPDYILTRLNNLFEEPEESFHLKF